MACPIGAYNTPLFVKGNSVHYSFCSKNSNPCGFPKTICYQSCNEWKLGQPRTVPLKTTLVATSYPPENWIIRRCSRAEVKWPLTPKPAPILEEECEEEEEEETAEECEEEECEEEAEECEECDVECEGEINRSNIETHQASVEEYRTKAQLEYSEEEIRLEEERGTNNASAMLFNRDTESPSFSELEAVGDGIRNRQSNHKKNAAGKPQINTSPSEKLRQYNGNSSDDSVKERRDVEIQVAIHEQVLSSRSAELTLSSPLRKKRNVLKRIFKAFQT